MKNDFFKKNHKYIVLEDFMGFLGDFFHKDEILTFKLVSYSRYDDCYVYDFIDNEGNSKSARSEEKEEAAFVAHFSKLDS